MSNIYIKQLDMDYSLYALHLTIYLIVPVPNHGI